MRETSCLSQSSWSCCQATLNILTLILAYIFKLTVKISPPFLVEERTACAECISQTVSSRGGQPSDLLFVTAKHYYSCCTTSNTTPAVGRTGRTNMQHEQRRSQFSTYQNLLKCHYHSIWVPVQNKHDCLPRAEEHKYLFNQALYYVPHCHSRVNIDRALYCMCSQGK